MADQKRTDDYYDEEARVYSAKRYPKRIQNYTHFLFTRRRTLALKLLARAIAGTKEPRTLLEVGCADGILLRSIAAVYPNAFVHMLGVDVAEPMIEVARKITKESGIEYKMRDELSHTGANSLVLEIGVAALVFDTQGELQIIANQLAPGGYLLCSFSGSTSLAQKFARGSAGDSSVLRPYSFYEKVMCEHFTQIASASYGFYVPLLWKLPVLARLLQPVAEVFSRVFPSLAHERLYLLKKI